MSSRRVLIALVSVLLLGVLFIATRNNEQSVAEEQCPIDTFLALSPEEQERCIQEAGGKANFVATVEARQIVTAEARPAEVIPTRHRPTQTVTPIGYIPSFASRLEPVSNEGQDWRGTESVWIVGSVQNTEGIHFPFFVWTAEVRCRIGTVAQIEASDAPFDDGLPLDAYWDCPSDKGILTITNVTSPTGILSFENEQSEVGTFNLATEEWTLDGEPWLPVATPTPVP